MFISIFDIITPSLIITLGIILIVLIFSVKIWIILLELSYIFIIYSLTFVFLSKNSISKYLWFCSGVNTNKIDTGNLLKLAPSLFGNKCSWKINGSVIISLIYLGFPFNSLISQSLK
jgi:hypothetical protein